MSKKYNGHKNYNHWNVSLWINGDEGLYSEAIHCIRHHGTRDEAAQAMLDSLHELGVTQTPDGVKYTKTTIRAAMVGM
jgi:hypothetical protein